MVRTQSRKLRGLAFVQSVIFLVALTALWWLACEQQWISRVFLPTPKSTYESLKQGLVSGELLDNTLSTVTRMIFGWMAASVLGVFLGAIVGGSKWARIWIAPTLEFVRPLPASAIIPVAISMFGLSSSMILSVVAFGAMWPVLLATAHGVGSTHSRLIEVAHALEMGQVAFLWKVGLPNAMPDIVSGLRLSLTVALIVTVVGEMISSQPGLGQMILLAARSFRASQMFAGVILLCISGFLASSLLAALERNLLRWQKAVE